jgi:lysophospholipase L1-like esterase
MALLAALLACAAAHGAAAPGPTPTPTPRLLRFLALGDSYTVGEGVSPDERWPERLVALLAARGAAVAPPEVIARTGWTTADLEGAIAEAAPKGPYDLVSLMIGVNDQFRGRTLEEYAPAFAALLAEAIAFAGGDPRRVLVLSIPDYGVTPFARRFGLDASEVSREIDRFDAAAREACVRASAHWVDVTTLSRRAAGEPDLIARDGLHPSPRLHGEWAAAVLPAARTALAASSSPP